MWDLAKSGLTSKGHTQQHQATNVIRSSYKVAWADDLPYKLVLAISLGGGEAGEAVQLRKTHFLWKKVSYFVVGLQTSMPARALRIQGPPT